MPSRIVQPGDARTVRARAVLLLGLVMAFGACGSRTLVPDGGVAGAAGTSGGAAGSSAAGVAGATGLGGAAGGAVGTPDFPALRISGAEAVQRIAAVLWQGPPDDDLVQMATGYQLEAELGGVIGQMLADPRAKVGLDALFRWWLDLDSLATLPKDPALFPELTPALRADMASEVVDLGIDVTLTDGDLRELLTTGEGFVNARLAAIYGIAGVTGDALQRTGRPGYAGLLTEAGLQALGSLANRTSPSHRGRYILEKLFCEQLPDSPPNVPPLAPTPGQSLRAALQAEVAAPACQACHSTFDPLGLVFEGFDAIGRARTTDDDGAAVDTSNLMIRLPSSSSNPATVNSPYDLGLLLAGAPDVQNCVAQKWLTFALGRPLTSADQPSLARVQKYFVSDGPSQLQGLITLVLTSDAFLAP